MQPCKFWMTLTVGNLGPHSLTDKCHSEFTRPPLEPNSTTRTPATDTSYGHHQRTSSQQFLISTTNLPHRIAMPEPNVSTYDTIRYGVFTRKLTGTDSLVYRIRSKSLWKTKNWKNHDKHVKMLGCDKFLSVGGVRSRCPCSAVWLLASAFSESEVGEVDDFRPFTHAVSATWCDIASELLLISPITENRAWAFNQHPCLEWVSTVCSFLSAKLHYTDTGNIRTCCITPPTDELTTILQPVVQQIHHQRTKICHIPTSCHVEMLGSGIAMWQICCRPIQQIVELLWACSFGGVVQHVRSRCPCSGVWH